MPYLMRTKLVLTFPFAFWSLASAGAMQAAGEPAQRQDGHATEVRSSPDEIVVTGERSSPRERQKAAVDFIRGTGVALGWQPVARWTDPVCPRAFGLEETGAGRVESEMRRIAQSAGIRVAKARCHWNIAVMFTADAAGTTRRLASQPGMLKEVSASEREVLLNGNAPVRWWYSSEVLSEDGVPGAEDSPPGAGTTDMGEPIFTGRAKVGARYNSSIVTTQTIRSIRSAVVVVDANRVKGRGLDAIASYAAMVAFAEVKGKPETTPHSILSTFARPDGPNHLTGWDEAFLTTLYKIPLAREAGLQRAKLVAGLLGAQEGR